MGYHSTGACDITFDGYDLGTTKPGGVVIRPRATWNPMLADQFGAVAGGHIFTGKSATVEATLVESDPSRGFVKLQRDMFPDGLLGCLVSSGSNLCKIGETVLGSGIHGSLRIDEQVSGEYWLADVAFIYDPAELLLASTSEQVVPLIFVVIPSGTPPLLFSQLPYL